jgi:5-methyltetrahydropteroyltriglutamate--homocysteine methyltransferase
MTLPTESIGSIPRPPALLEGIEQFRLGKLSQVKLETLYEDALKDTIACLEATGSPVVSEGEQTKSSLVTYRIGLSE